MSEYRMSSNSNNDSIKTGSELIVEYLIKEGLPYIFGIPGHGSLGLTDALYRHKDKIQVIQPKQEMAGVHMAVGYYRVTGKPLAVFTSIGPGAINTAIGLADAYVDSMPVLVLTGDTHVHMRGVGVLQEIERNKDSAMPKVVEPLVKRQFELAHVNQVPKVIQRAFNIMMTGRRGPVHIDLPMDVQCSEVNKPVPEPNKRKTYARPRGDPALIKEAAKMLINAKRPVIWLGGGVVTSEAYKEVKKLAEFTGGAVLASMMAKDAFPNDHPLFGWATGSKGTKIGIELSKKADVVIAVGSRFADESTCSYRKGIAWTFGNNESDTRLIHIDIDPHEIGKNYATDIGIVGDAKAVLKDLLQVLNEHYKPVDYENSDYFKEIQKLRKEWKQFVDNWADPTKEPVMISCVLKEVRDFLDRDAVIVTSSGNVQAQMIQEIEFYEPNTCITAGGFSTMGYTVPAAIGAKLGKPEKQVVGLVGDGDFMMTMHELHTAMQLNLNVVIVILNNMGWIAITDLQRAVYGEKRGYATEFFDKDNKPYSPNFADIARGFGCWSTRISKNDEIKPALEQAFQQNGPAVIEILVNRDPRYTGSPAWGWWDVPIPAYMEEKRSKYEKEINEEDL
ncbi:MAG: thiamine pyrophosphate-binding protein [Candidatus Lokiarchaeota archaeon]|nr:thiamine pyrophosphate-binding protein [Candidatus Lokiarchaeota archaeon]